MTKQQFMNDIFGKALLDYYNGNYTEDIITFSSVAGEDSIPLTYLFRDYDKMPLVEQKALDLAFGKVLDIGCGSGCHSIYLQNININVRSIDISKGAVEVCKQRGIKNVEIIDIWELKGEKFDTILALMNGTGICGKLENLTEFLTHLKSLLKPGGQILIDSSDINFMFESETYYLEKSATYFGEVSFVMEYKEERTLPFDWLYTDLQTLKEYAKRSGLNCEMIVEGVHFDYLAKLTITES